MPAPRLRLQPGRWVLCVLLGLPSLFPAWAQAQTETMETYFKNKCAICHYIGGGKLIGPDLKDLQHTIDLKGRGWVEDFIRDPKGLVASDAYARKLWEDYNKVDMVVPGPPVDSALAQSLVDFILKEAGKKEGSPFAKGGSDPFKDYLLPTGQFQENIVAEGREYFSGLKRFANGGPACLSCHSLPGVGAFGGGRLGPELSPSFNKLKGREGLFGWLSSPPTPAMQPIYRNHQLDDRERVALVAFLEQARGATEPESAARLNFFLFGLAGTVGALFLCDHLWRRRFRAVRTPLVHGEQKEQA